MKKLELLGLQNDGEHLTLNDAEGNRYSLEITSELRAALRNDVKQQAQKDDSARPITPREIQAYVRAGKTVAEISELTSIPPSKIETLAHPIINERNYTAKLARSLPTTRDPGSLTLEELVATRLASRGVKSEDIEWDAIRESGEPWTIIARYESAERERKAVWHVNLQKRSLEAISEEAIWLSETPLLPHGEAWRAPNTPPLRPNRSSPAPSVSSLPTPSAPATQNAQRSQTTQSAPSAPSPEKPAEPKEKPTTPKNIRPTSVSRIDAVLADLDSRRGIPTDKKYYSTLAEATAASALESANTPAEDKGESDKTPATPPTRETIFDLPVRPVDTDVSGRSAPSARTPYQGNDLFSSAASADSAISSQSQSQMQKKVPRSDRPSMPSWDEIVFGKKD